MATTETARFRVLVVDDDPEICALFRAIADTDPSIDIVAASSPEEAMGLSRDQPPDAILLDHSFPTAEILEHADVATRANRGMTGLEAVEFLRSTAPDAVIAIFTGSADLADSVEHAGADLYLVKGPSPRAVLDQLADRARQRLA